MKRLGLALLGLLVVLLAAVLVAPSFVDWNAHKSRLAEEVRMRTGRDLTIGGDISLDLLPAPTFSAGKVAFANLEGASAPAMAEFESLRVRIALLPLLHGEVKVESIVLVKPVIRLEVLPDGRKNWDFAAAKAGAPAVQTAEAGSPAPIRLDNVRITDGTLIYRDARNGREETVRNLNAQVAAATLRGPFAVSGDAVVRGVATKFDVNLGRLPKDGAAPLSVDLQLPGPAAKIQLGGAVSMHPTGVSLRGRLKIEGGDLAAFVAQLGRSVEAPAMLARPFGIEAEISADPAKVSAMDLALRMGDMSVEGEATVKLEPAIDARINLAATRIDLDKLLVAPQAAPPRGGTGAGSQGKGTAAAPGAGPGAASGAASAGPPMALPADVTGALEVTVDAVIYRGEIIRQVLLSANLAKGRIKIGQAIALLPGGADVSVTGTVAPQEGGAGPLGFDGRVEAAADNLRGVLGWMGIKVADIPAERLRKASLSARVAARPRHVTVSDIDLRVDLSRATGGIAIALRERPGFGIGLAVDKLNLDAYLPAGLAPDQPPGGGPGATQGAGQTAAPAAGTLAGPGGLGAFDANLDLRLGRLTLRGTTARDLRLDATLQQGAITVREARVGDLAGGKARIAGRVTGLAGEPAVDATLALSVADPVRLAKLAGIAPGPAGRIGPFELTGSFKGGMTELALKADLAALGGRFGAAGTLKGLGPAATFDLALEAKHPSLAKLAGAVAPGLSLDPALGGVDLAAHATGTASRVELRGLTGKLGPTDLAGTVAADFAGARPALDLDLTTGVLPLAALAAPAAGPQQGAAPDPAGAAGAAPAAPTSDPPPAGRWSVAPIDLSALNALDATFKVRAAALLLGKVRLDDAVLEGALRGGVLDLTKATGTAFGGAVSATGQLDARARPSAGAALSATGLDLAKLARAVAESDRVSGPLDLEAKLSTDGQSEAELIGALAGSGRLTGSLTVETKAEEQLGAALLGVLGKQVKEIRGVTDATNAVFNAFGGRPAALAGTFTVDKGVVRTDDLKATGQDATAVTRGTASLPAWQIDTRTDLIRAQDAARPYLSVELSGPLDGPNVRVSGQPFQRRQPAPAQTDGQASPAPGPAPAVPEKIEPKEILKKGLKELLKGLQN